MSGRSEGKPEPPRTVVALRYDPAVRPAPDVVAKGRGELADRILAVAREHGVPVREDGDLLELLSACDLGDEIPVELYQVVAELLHYVFTLNREMGAAPQAPPR